MPFLGSLAARAPHKTKVSPRRKQATEMGSACKGTPVGESVGFAEGAIPHALASELRGGEVGSSRSLPE